MVRTKTETVLMMALFAVCLGACGKKTSLLNKPNVKAAPPQLISVNYYVDFYSSPFNQTSWPSVNAQAPSVARPRPDGR